MSILQSEHRCWSRGLQVCSCAKKKATEWSQGTSKVPMSVSDCRRAQLHFIAEKTAVGLLKLLVEKLDTKMDAKSNEEVGLPSSVALSTAMLRPSVGNDSGSEAEAVHRR